MKVFTDTNYREHGAGALVEYIDKEEGLQNRFGEQMSEEEIQTFIDKSDEYGFERQIIISPKHGDQLSNRELSLYTRKVMSEFCTDRQTATYCFAIHRDTDHPHTQIAITGTKRDLWMDRDDCHWLRERATEQFHEQHNELTSELSHDLEAAFTNEFEYESALARGREKDDSRNFDVDQAVNQHSGGEATRSREQGPASRSNPRADPESMTEVTAEMEAKPRNPESESTGSPNFEHADVSEEDLNDSGAESPEQAVRASQSESDLGHSSSDREESAEHSRTGQQKGDAAKARGVEHEP